LVVYIVAALILLSIFGMRGSLTSLLAGAGFLGIVVGMATKDFLSGIISGMVIYIDRPFKIGDWIEVDGEQGIVQDLSLQTTRIRTFAGELMSVPNSKIANSIVINKTDEPNSRIDIGIGVDYETDMNKTLVLCKEILEEEEDVLEDPEPSLVIDEFADSSINLMIRFWVNRQDLKERGVGLAGMKSNIRKKLLQRFRAEGIEIPFPHVEVIRKD
jgi:small-conductance mechanosensitive channel